MHRQQTQLIHNNAWHEHSTQALVKRIIAKLYYHDKWLDGENVSEMTCFCVEWKVQELIRRWDSERELLRSTPERYTNSLK